MTTKPKPSPQGNYYDSERAASEYLLLHYGDASPWPLTFPARCVAECLDAKRLPENSRALDLGCAVGGASFELARHCGEVIGIDASRQFIEIAQRLRERGEYRFQCCVEGELKQPRGVSVSPGMDRKRVAFETGDAMRLRDDLGTFDVVMMANLIDRLPNPRALLGQLPGLVNRGGQLIITSPYTWLREYTPRANWLGGFKRGGRPVRTFDALKRILSPAFRLVKRRNIPFLIREHARKFQLGIAEASVWVRVRESERSPRRLEEHEDGLFGETVRGRLGEATLPAMLPAMLAGVGQGLGGDA